MKTLIFRLVLITFISFITTNVSFAQKKQNALVVKYINEYKNIAIDEMLRYRIPASITLAQGILESGWGRSELAAKSNNHFGIKCKSSWNGKRVYHDDDEKGECFRKYNSPKDSYEDHSIFLSEGQRYAFLFKLRPTDYKGWAHGLKKAGYATNPKYAHILIDLIELYHLDKYDSKKHNRNSKNDKLPTLKDEITISVPIIIGETSVDNSEPKPSIKNLGSKRGRKRFSLNNSKFVLVEKNDTWSTLSKATGKKVSQLYQYNEITDPEAKLEVGTNIFFSKKKKSAGLQDQKLVIDKEGETIYKISQRYAIRSSVLSELNSLMKHEKLPLNKIIELK